MNAKWKSMSSRQMVILDSIVDSLAGFKLIVVLYLGKDSRRVGMFKNNTLKCVRFASSGGSSIHSLLHPSDVSTCVSTVL